MTTPQRPTSAEFRTELERRLDRARALIPSVAPDNENDPALDALFNEIFAIETYLADLDATFDADAQRMQEQETARERRVVAKRRRPSLESIVTRLDERVQRIVQVIGASHESAASGAAYDKFVGAMFLDLLLDAFVALLDAVPSSAFSEERVVPGSSGSLNDPTVKGILRLMRERIAAREPPEHPEHPEPPEPPSTD